MANCGGKVNVNVKAADVELQGDDKPSSCQQESRVFSCHTDVPADHSFEPLVLCPAFFSIAGQVIICLSALPHCY